MFSEINTQKPEEELRLENRNSFIKKMKIMCIMLNKAMEDKNYEKNKIYFTHLYV